MGLVQLDRPSRRELYDQDHRDRAEWLKYHLRAGNGYCYCTHCGDQVSERRFRWLSHRDLGVSPSGANGVGRGRARVKVELSDYAVRHHLIKANWSPGVLICNRCHTGSAEEGVAGYFHTPSHWIYCPVLRTYRNRLDIIVMALIKQWIWLRRVKHSSQGRGRR